MSSPKVFLGCFLGSTISLHLILDHKYIFLPTCTLCPVFVSLYSWGCSQPQTWLAALWTSYRLPWACCCSCCSLDALQAILEQWMAFVWKLASMKAIDPIFISLYFTPPKHRKLNFYTWTHQFDCCLFTITTNWQQVCLFKIII